MDALPSFPDQPDTPDTPESGITHLEGAAPGRGVEAVEKDALRPTPQAGPFALATWCSATFSVSVVASLPVSVCAT